MMKIVFLVLLTGVLGACATVPYNSSNFSQKFAEDVSADASDIRYHGRCTYGVTALSASTAVFQDCVYVHKKNEIWVLGWHHVARRYQKDLVIPFTRIDRAALYSFGLGRQLQLFSDVGKIAITVEDSDKAFSLLKDAGVPVTESPGMVRPSESTVVPIFIK